MCRLTPLIRMSVLCLFVSACATVDTPSNVASNETNVAQITPNNTVSDTEDTSSLAFYLRTYLAKNISERSRASRGLIDRSGIETNGRLPSKALFQSLGYRMRDSFIAMPPEIGSRTFHSDGRNLFPKLIQNLEATWALLDSTQARLQSKGGLEAGRQDWEVEVVRRNLLLEATGYWYQMRNQESHSDWLIRLGDRSDELFEEISRARQNYDVEDQKDHELVLLNMRADVATLFQFYSSEQARLYNRTGQRVLPVGRDNELPNFNTPLQCRPKFDVKAMDYLNRYYKKQLDTITSTNYNAAVYELDELAREVAKQALESYAVRLQEIEQDYVLDRTAAQQQRNVQIESLEQRLRGLDALAQEALMAELEELKNAPLDVSRRSNEGSDSDILLFNVIKVLAGLAAEKIMDLNQLRLNQLLTNPDHFYQETTYQIKQGATKEMRVLHSLLEDVYDYSVIDYLLGYERLSFVNQALLHACSVGGSLNSRVIGFDPKGINELAYLIENRYQSGFALGSLTKRLNGYGRLESAFASKKAIGIGYVVDDAIDPDTGDVIPGFEFKSQGGQEVLVSAKQQEYNRINARMVEKGLALASKADILAFTQGRGYTLEIAETESLSDVFGLVSRYGVNNETLIYRTNKTATQAVLLKVLLGSERDYDDILQFQKKANIGLVKSFLDVRNEIYDE